MPVLLLEVGNGELVVARLQALARRDDVDVVSLERNRAGHLPDGHRRFRLQELVEAAFALGVEVQNHDEAHARLGRQGLEEVLQGLQAARRGPDAYNERLLLGALIGACDRVGGGLRLIVIHNHLRLV